MTREKKITDREGKEHTFNLTDGELSLIVALEKLTAAIDSLRTLVRFK